MSLSLSSSENKAVHSFNVRTRAAKTAEGEREERDRSRPTETVIEQKVAKPYGTWAVKTWRYFEQRLSGLATTA